MTFVTNNTTPNSGNVEKHINSQKTKKNMKSLILFLFLLMALSLEAKRIKLSFIPKAHIIVFHYSGLTIYTDSSSLLNIFSNCKSEQLQIDSKRVRSIVLMKFKESKNDTIHFSDSVISSNDSISYSNYKMWINTAIIELTKHNKLKIINSQGKQVKVILTNKIRYKDERIEIVQRNYIDKSTNEMLFIEPLKGHFLDMY